MILEVPGEPGSQLSERFLVGGGGGNWEKCFWLVPSPMGGEQDEL